MGVKSTRDITRDQAIERITDIIKLYEESNWNEIKNQTSETEEMYGISMPAYVSGVVNTANKIGVVVDNWTNEQLSFVMDLEFYRYSAFDNYIVHDSEDGYE